MTTKAPRYRISITAFVVLLFVVSWIGTIPMILASYGQSISGLEYLQVLLLFGPGLVTMYTVGFNEGWQGLKKLLQGLLQWRVNVKWWLFVLFLPGLSIIAAHLIGSWWNGGTAKFYSLDQSVPYFLTTFASYFFLNSEELAWRGYLFPKLQLKRGSLQSSVIVGILWALFHAPLFLMKNGHPAGYNFILYTLMVFTFSFAMSYFYNHTNRSLLIVHVLHQSLNTWGEVIPFYPKSSGHQYGVAALVIISSLLAYFLILSDKSKTHS
jgi:membrane protease YdiL (CAAX protease family)